MMKLSPPTSPQENNNNKQAVDNHPAVAAASTVLPESSSWMLLLRGPLLWSSGVLTLLLVAYYNAWYQFDPPTTAVGEKGVLLAPPMAIIIIAGIVFVVVVLTIMCSMIFWNDLYAVVLHKTVRPVAVAASDWSLDDILKLLCDPTQLATYLSALFLFPITLYTLPTTPEQRTKALQSAGLLSSNHDDSVLTQAGEWKQLLPESMQTVLNKSMAEGQQHTTPSINGFHENETDTDQGSDASSGDGVVEEQVEEEEEYFPYSVSPVYRTERRSRALPDVRHTEPNHHLPENENDEPDHLPATAKEQSSEPYDLMKTILLDYVKKHLQHFVSDNRVLPEKNTAVIISVTAAMVLGLQLKHSRVARRTIQTIFHLLVTAGSSTTLLASVVALVAPHIAAAMARQQQHQQQQQQQQHQQTQRRATTTNTSSWTVSDANGWSLQIASSVAALAAMYMSIPRSLSRVNNSMVSWKGALAALVLFYFQHRRRRIQRRAHLDEEESASN